MSELSYTYDAVGNRTGQTEAGGAVTTWTYDEVGQLVREQRAGGDEEGFDIQYQYDGAGNRTLRTADGVTTTYTYSPANRLQTAVSPDGVTTYTHDKAGNRKQVNYPGSGGISYFAYDAAGRMTQAETPGSAGPVTLTYNADGQRVRKETAGGDLTQYLYDFNNLLQEFDGDDDPVRSYTATDDEYGDLLSEYDELDDTGTPGEGEFYRQFDAQANLEAMTDDAGSITQKFKFQAFGLPASSGQTGWANLTAQDWSTMSPADWSRLPVNPSSRLAWGGQKQYYLDPETELYLLGMGSTGGTSGGGRYYDPETGRFLSEDRLRYGAGDPNLFRYVGNDPINKNDPSGKQTGNDDELAAFPGLTPEQKALLLDFKKRMPEEYAGIIARAKAIIAPDTKSNKTSEPSSSSNPPTPVSSPFATWGPPWPVREYYDPATGRMLSADQYKKEIASATKSNRPAAPGSSSNSPAPLSLPFATDLSAGRWGNYDMTGTVTFGPRTDWPSAEQVPFNDLEKAVLAHPGDDRLFWRASTVLPRWRFDRLESERIKRVQASSGVLPEGTGEAPTKDQAEKLLRETLQALLTEIDQQGAAAVAAKYEFTEVDSRLLLVIEGMLKDEKWRAQVKADPLLLQPPPTATEEDRKFAADFNDLMSNTPMFNLLRGTLKVQRGPTFREKVHGVLIASSDPAVMLLLEFAAATEPIRYNPAFPEHEPLRVPEAPSGGPGAPGLRTAPAAGDPLKVPKGLATPKGPVSEPLEVTGTLKGAGSNPVEVPIPLSKAKLQQLREGLQSGKTVVLEPNNSYTSAEGTVYRTDSTGQVMQTTYTLNGAKDVKAVGDLRTATGNATTPLGEPLSGVKGDVGFHARADAAKGIEDYPNVFPGNENLNVSAWKSVENSYIRAARLGSKIEITITQTRGSGSTGVRPSQIEIEIRCNGKIWRTTFNNNANNGPLPSAQKSALNRVLGIDDLESP